MSGRDQAPGARWIPRHDGYFADLAELRQAAYGLLGSLFLFPGRQDIAEIAAASVEFRRQSDLAGTFPFLPRLRAVLDLVEGLADGARRRLEEAYVDLFVVGTSQDACPPYESSYVEREGLERGLVAVEVERTYAASGVVLASSDELPDHAALELAFLSVLCGEEAAAWREARAEQVADCLSRERAFHDRHLQRWFPAFARRVMLAAGPESFYRQLAEAAHAFVVHDRDLIRPLNEACSLGAAKNRALLG